MRLHLDQLTEFHLKDPERLIPGAKVLFGHVPPLVDPELRDSKAYPHGELAAVREVGLYSFNELHNQDSEGEWATKRKHVVKYTSLSSTIFGEQVRHRYLSDSGVEPYQGTFYNGTNFTVLLSDLEAAGVEHVLDVSEAYKAELEIFNEKVHEVFYDLY